MLGQVIRSLDSQDADACSGAECHSLEGVGEIGIAGGGPLQQAAA